LTLDNPLFDMYQKYFVDAFSLSRGSLSELVKNQQLRDQAIVKYSWAIPTEEALLEIKKLQPITEWFAGAGYWAYCLRQIGAKIEAWSLEPGYQGTGKTECWTKVHKCMEQPPLVINSKALLVVWPPLGIGVGILCAFTGDWIIHVGEGAGGCTGSKEFHHLLADGYNLEQVIDIPQWEGLHDSVFIWKRKAGNEICRSR